MVHMAAIPAPFYLPDDVVHNNNVVGSYNAMRAAIEQGIRKICQASSVSGNARGSASPMSSLAMRTLRFWLVGLAFFTATRTVSFASR